MDRTTDRPTREPLPAPPEETSRYAETHAVADNEANDRADYDTYNKINDADEKKAQRRRRRR